MGPNAMANVLIRRGKFGHRHRHTGGFPCDKGASDWSDVST